MNDTEIKEMNELSSACRAVYDEPQFDQGYRLAHLINARDIAALAEKHGVKGAPRDAAIWLRKSCEKFLQQEAEIGQKAKQPEQ